jgi:hypothetical protein
MFTVCVYKSAWSLLHDGFLLALLFNPEREDDAFSGLHVSV